MDVRCERCRAQYVFDDEQVTPGGLTVQCTNCGHVFRVKVKELVVTVPVKPGELDGVPIPATAAAPKPAAAKPPSSPEPSPHAAPAAAPPPAPAAPPSTFLKADEKAKEWRVRQANGNVFTFKELTTLQKWIVEQKVTRDDEISLSGDQWKRLGNIAELASFFQVVEAAESARAYAPMPAVTPIPMPPYPVIQAPPAGRAVDVELDEADLAQVRRGRGWVVSLVLLILAAGGAGGLYVWRPDLLGLAPRAPALGHEVPITFEVKPPVTAPPAGDPVSPPADNEAPPPDATPLPAPVQEGEAPLPKAPEPIAKAEPGEVQPPPSPARGPKQLLADAQRLRERGSFDKSIGLYERVIQAQPGNARALAGRGLCYLDLQQYALAEQSFRAALRADPEEADALLGLAEAARYQGKKPEAIQHYERYLALHPDGEEAVAARNAIQQLKE
ncbi:MAG TPA: tetratricopeptide repeat protein [Anaeromyxobacteraceae bacterium]|nr:tetratricopeptide repeat protein [Anaeromyxobacteraceae bacterium]